MNIYSQSEFKEIGNKGLVFFKREIVTIQSYANRRMREKKPAIIFWNPSFNLFQCLNSDVTETELEELELAIDLDEIAIITEDILGYKLITLLCAVDKKTLKKEYPIFIDKYNHMTFWQVAGNLKNGEIYVELDFRNGGNLEIGLTIFDGVLDKYEGNISMLPHIVLNWLEIKGIKINSEFYGNDDDESEEPKQDWIMAEIAIKRSELEILKSNINADSAEIVETVDQFYQNGGGIHPTMLVKLKVKHLSALWELGRSQEVIEHLADSLKTIILEAA